MRGSVRLALRAGLAPLVVGLTVVALGTSAPEAVVSIVAAAEGSSGIALGNVLGSNIANIGLILGIITLLHPLRSPWRRLKRDYFVMLATSFAAAALILGGVVPRWGGFVLLAAQLLLLAGYVRSARKGDDPHAEELLAEVGEVEVEAQGGILWPLVQAAIGLGLLVVGARVLVGAAVAIATALGIPEEIVGVTMVAVGTSLPELAASVVAVLRGHHDIGLGNILGSNVMNLLFVLGGASAIAPIEVHEAVLTGPLPWMIGYALVLGIMLRTHDRISRGEGALLLGSYLVFCWMSY